MIELGNKRFDLALVPEVGGSIARLRWRHADGNWVDLLRPMSENSIQAKDSLGAACFPLFPFSNRIRSGKFRFENVQYSLPLNVPEPHPQHGHGWQRPWSLITSNHINAKIGFVHDPSNDATWPFAYEAWQHFAVSMDALTITFGARNLDRKTMPIGIGLHPYFLRTPKCVLQAIVGGFWETDAEVLPTRHRDVPMEFDINRGLMMHNVVIDNLFTEFEGNAEILWPELRTRLRLHTQSPLRNLVVYAPDAPTLAAERAQGIPNYFCAEPVSNITDAFNIAVNSPSIDTGMAKLSEGEELVATMSFLPEPA